jgi:uncharacterized protein YukE
VVDFVFRLAVGHAHICAVAAPIGADGDRKELVMPFMGADHEQLAQLGRTLRSQPEAIAQMITAVTNGFHNSQWTGPAKDRFQSEWDTSFRTALNRLDTAFRDAGEECIKLAEGLNQYMGR